MECSGIIVYYSSMNAIARVFLFVDVVFRLFVGLEYECPRGHRFFLCAPDRLFKVPPSGLYKVLSK